MAVHHRASHHTAQHRRRGVGPLVKETPPTGGDEALGLVDFSIFPHLDHEKMPDNSMANAAKWAASLWAPGYAIDDQTAIKVTDDAVEVISEGHWQLFTP
jgi:dipeptidase E